MGVCVCVCVRVCAWFSSQKCSYDAFSHAGVIIIKQTNKQTKRQGSDAICRPAGKRQL